MKRTTGVTVGLVIAGILGLSDAVGPLTGVGDGPPMAVMIADALLGIVTVVGVVFGWRGNRGGIIAVIVSRILSAMSALPAFFVSDVPKPAVVVAAVGITITLVAVVLVVPALRTRHETAVA
jgi:hypothetical protein